MAAAHGGDKAVYEQLLRELGDTIERYLRCHFGRLAHVEDCVQECLLAIHMARHTWDPHRRFRPWFFTIVHHKTIDLLRRASYAPPPHEDRVPPGIGLGLTTTGDPADEMVPGDILTRLPPAYRDALKLTKIEGYSLAEAAARAGISEAAMKSRVARAIRATKALLETDRNSA